MKKVLLLMMLATTWGLSKGQQIDISYANDSSYFNCSLPTNVGFMVNGTASGYAAGDSITYTLWTGDGSVHTQKFPASPVYYGYINHQYTTNGNFTVKYKVELPGDADSLTKANEFIAGPCGTLTGKVFYDQNGNCAYDAGELTISNSLVSLTSPGDPYPSYSVYSNASGDYTFNAPLTNGMFSISHAGSSNCGINGTAVNISSTVDIPLSSPLGVQYTNSTYNNCTGSNFSIYGQLFAAGYSAGDTVFVTIHYGDGTSDTYGLPANQQMSFYGTHLYSSPGSYNVWITSVLNSYTDTHYISSPVVANVCGNITGTVYEDLNNNCLQDAGESGLANKLIIVYGGTTIAGSATTDNAGNYSVQVPAGATYTVASSLYNYGYLTTCPAGGTSTVSSFPATADFAMECIQTFDFKVWGNNSGIVPGNVATFNFFADNAACAAASGQLSVVFDQAELPIDSFSVNPTSTSGDTLIWAFGPAGIVVTVYAMADTTLQLGDTLCFPISATPVTGDYNPLNNYYNLCKTVTASYDPNMKEGWHGKGQQGLISQNTTLDYTIHFQNTGTAPAMNVYIRDTLPAGLNPATLEILGSSHPMDVYTWQGNQLKFQFNNINLPDSNSNEPMSHGYIVYRIRTAPNLPNGSTIRNGAAIYFDYNAPVITNKTLHTIDIFLDVTEEKSELQVSLFPNPTQGNIQVEFSEEKGDLRIFDLKGAEVFRSVVRKGQNQFDVSKLAPGMYIFSISSGEDRVTGKIICH